MCGFCGFACSNEEQPLDVERLRAMNAAIAHRGPDGLGEYTAAGVALGHRRLSIIDIEGGQQPLSNEDGSIWIVFNGEIYNFAELAQRLKTLGHQFRTRSDTEVIVHAYEEYGLDFVTHLNGMFALAIHDTKRSQVVLARDHFGIKPLFYSISDGELVFGSEIKSVLIGTGARPAPNPKALIEYIIFRYSAGARTFFSGVSRLPPASIAVWSHGRLAVRRYWSPPRPEVDSLGDCEVQRQFADKLENAVTSQLISEVPLGSFCSGGVDSGLVTAHASLHSDVRFRTFSVGFEEGEWDETSRAVETSERYGTDHHSLTLRAHDLLSLVPTLLGHNDEPLSHPNSVPLYLLSGLARKYVTVVLTGEGADELFCGYPRYRIETVRSAAENLPPGVRRMLANLARAGGRRGRLLGRGLSLAPEMSLVLNSAYVDPSVAADLTGTDPNEAFGERLEIAARSYVPRDPFATISAYELQTYLQCALDRMDRMSMAHGLEGRVPFLDVALAEWGSALPSRFKADLRKGKVVVKRHANNWLPANVVQAAKSGFGLPLDDWFRSSASAGLLATIKDSSHPASAVLDTAVVRRLVTEHIGGSQDHGEVLWVIANVFLWYDHVRPIYT